MNTAVASTYKSPAPTSKHVGYSILRAGKAGAEQICVTMPHVDAPRSISLNEAKKRLEIDVGGARLLLAQLPDDLVQALKREPRRVLLVTVDTLSRLRFSALASKLLAAQL
jgi:hypothetical protein